MLYYSTNGNSSKVDFRQATILGQAPDKGLFFPESIPLLPEAFLQAFRSFTKAEIGWQVMHPYVGSTIPKNVLERIISETLDFPFPLERITGEIDALELFHGPTMAFKDVGARFMSRCLGYFVQEQKKKLTVLVATSGDTGGAVAHGFYQVDGVEVIILYPSGKVSSLQELQLTTLGNNITALEVDGSFDDCQQMVKDAFVDQQLQKDLHLTSANSINVARWLPQQLYYFLALKEWKEKDLPVISVPSGNFGNLCAGLIAWKSGLPVKHFIAACNANDVFPRFLQNGQYQPGGTQHTLSNAMDVGNPSNFIRLFKLFDESLTSIRKQVSAFTISDEETKATIRDVYDQHQYLLDPHGAVAFASLKKYLTEHSGDKGFILETAHPVKFYDAVEPFIGRKIPLPAAMKNLMGRKKHSIRVKPEFKDLKEFLLDRN